MFSQTDPNRAAKMLTQLATSLIAMAVPATTGTCPQGVIEQLDGLYRWQVQRMDSNEDRVKALSSQRQRFTPSLFRLLMEARQLTPSRDGRFLDFDVFSNTQVATFGAKVSGCSAEKGNSIEARVDVEAGLTGRPSGTPRRLLYELNRDGKGNWRINNITYLDGKVFQLRPFLQELLQSTS
ncbi:hypothetical protein SynBIOSE41_01396 [Synechococcus sp. BIOS-E4-1]|nr:hypothetical protein SynBIOSE41_01396 [Synechococcus sp. BIOS-E4-1]